MHVCENVCARVFVCVCVCLYVCVCTHVFVCVCLCFCSRLCDIINNICHSFIINEPYKRTCLDACVHTCVCVCVCVCVCTRVFVCVCLCLLNHIGTIQFTCSKYIIIGSCLWGSFLDRHNWVYIYTYNPLYLLFGWCWLDGSDWRLLRADENNWHLTLVPVLKLQI